MKNLNKDKVLNAAEKRMLQFGYRKVTMDEIAGDLRMSKNTIYKEFKSKIEIAESLLNRLKNKINTYQFEVEKNCDDPLEMLSKNIFYLQNKEALQQGALTKTQTGDVALIKLGNELHGPMDEMRVNRNQVLFIEDMKADSKIVKAIMDYIKK